MNYATTARRPNPLAALGAMGAPLSFGAILVLGLAVQVTLTPDEPRTEGFFVHVKPEVEPPPPPEITHQTQQAEAPISPAPRTDTPIIPVPEFTFSGSDPIEVGTGLDESWGSDLGPIAIEPPPRPELSFDPVKASPRGNPANWITTADYRSSWIRRELTGTARFSLAIDASGKVSGCTITGSTGHEALDRATCALIERRAVFNPAKGSDGEPIAGTFSSSVNWTIPD